MATPSADDAVEIFLRLGSARNVLDRAAKNTSESKSALGKGSIAEALERFGVAHEDLHETTMIAKQFPAAQAQQILESASYRQLLSDLENLEDQIASRCTQRTDRLQPNHVPGGARLYRNGNHRKR